MGFRTEPGWDFSAVAETVSQHAFKATFHPIMAGVRKFNEQSSTLCLQSLWMS